MSSKPASKLRFYWIAFMTGVYTLWASTNIIFSSFLFKNHRPIIDRVLTRWSKRLLGLIRVTTKVTGSEHFPINSGRPVIIMSNHSSLYDVPVAIVALHFGTSFRFVTKKELYKIPIFGSALRGAEFISIDRQNHDQAIKDLQKAKEKMLDGITLWMAPEGTRSKDGKLAKFKRGAFHIAVDTSALIVPIVIKDIHKVQAGDNLDLYLNQQIVVEVCPPVDAGNYTVENRRELIDTVRQSMLKGLGQTE